MESLLHTFATVWIVASILALVKHGRRVAREEHLDKYTAWAFIIIMVGVTIWAAWYLGLRL